MDEETDERARWVYWSSRGRVDILVDSSLRSDTFRPDESSPYIVGDPAAKTQPRRTPKQKPLIIHPFRWISHPITPTRSNSHSRSYKHTHTHSLTHTPALFFRWGGYYCLVTVQWLLKCLGPNMPLLPNEIDSGSKANSNGWSKSMANLTSCVLRGVKWRGPRIKY